MAKEVAAIGNVIDLDKYIGNDNKESRIDRVGIELEGGWFKVPTYKGKKLRLDHDGSVRDLVKKLQSDPPFLPDQNEIASHPMQLCEMPTWVKAVFPNASNETCGLHVHFSFANNLNYQRLLTPDLTETTLEYLARWGKKYNLPAKHPIWSRLRGEKEHCQKIYWGERQVMATKDNSRTARTRVGHRYTVWNYPYKHLKTAECRVLPMFDDPDTCISAIWFLADIVNSFLLATAKKEEKFKISASIDDTSLHREILNDSLEPRKRSTGMTILTRG